MPRKNIRHLGGVPLLTRVIRAAKQAQVFDEIMVSTEDAEIAGIAIDAGAAVPFRRSVSGASDHASTTEVIQEVLACYSKMANGDFTHVCCLYPTAVLCEPVRLAEGLRLLVDDVQVDSAMAVQMYSHPIERAYRLRDGELKPVEASKEGLRTQDLESAYYDAGQFYWFRTSQFLRTASMLGDRCAPVVLAPWEAVDLDHESDWLLLERMIATRNGPELGVKV